MNLKMLITAMVLVLLATFVANAATVTPVAPGLNAAIGQAYSISDNSIYFVQYNSGKVSRFNLTTGSVTTIHSGLAFPVGIAMYPGTDVAYVTTRDGNLWKVHTTSAARGLVASGLGESHAIVVDPSRFVAYVTDFAGGQVLRVDLGGAGARTTVVSGLINPVGLLLSADFNTAYVAEPNSILSINLATGMRTTLASGLTNAFFMDWADDARNSIYYVERDPANRVSRLDLLTSSSTPIAPVSFRPSSVVRTLDPCTIYVASDTVIERVYLCSPGGPVITRLGHIPSTSINPVTGQATTDPSYFFRVKNASFGGSIHTMLDFPGMRSLGASYYKVMLDGATDTTPEIASWVNHRWNGSTFVPQTVVPALGFYEVPSGLWAIPDLGFVLDSTRLTNGRHTLRVKLYDFTHYPIWWVPEAQVAILVDNEAPTVRIDRIEHDGSPLDECALITTGSTKLYFTFTAYDPQGHLYSYGLTDGWGRGRPAAPMASDQYVGVHDASPTWFGVSPRNYWHELCSTSVSCAHAFTLTASGNTTNGYSYIHSSTTSDHVAVFLPGAGCP